MQKMQKLFFLLIVSLIFIACEPTRRAAPPLPPGVERGQTWEEASDFGYEEPVYITPEYVAYALKGWRKFRLAIHKTYRSDVCDNNPESATVRYVISGTGEILNIHPITTLENKCLDELRETFKSFEFFPAEHHDEPVNMMMAITFTRARI